MANIEGWINEIPVVTRCWGPSSPLLAFRLRACQHLDADEPLPAVAASVAASIAVVRRSHISPRTSCPQLTGALVDRQQCHVVAPLHLYFSWKATFGNLQVSKFS